MDDLISRQAAVSRISDLLMLDLKGQRLPTWDEVNEAINELPSARQWIPVSSGILPEMNKPVLVTHNGKYQAFVSVDWIDPCTNEWNRTCNVVAWRELPEPYRGGEEECH